MTTLTSQTHTKLDKLQTFPNRNKETNQESRMDIYQQNHYRRPLGILSGPAALGTIDKFNDEISTSMPFNG
jgi:hypothetical protein